MSKQISYLLYSKKEKGIIISRVCPVVYETEEQCVVDKGHSGLYVLCKETRYALTGETIGVVNDYQEYISLWCNCSMIEALVMLDKHLNKIEG